MSIFRRSSHRLSYAIVFLIARLCTLPADHCMALRSEICLQIVMLRSIVEAELSQFLKDPDAAGLPFLRDDIAECYIMTAHTELDLKSPAILVLECTYSLRSLISHIRSLASVHLVRTSHWALLHAYKLQLREVSDICTHSKTRGAYKRIALMLYLIVGLSVNRKHIHICNAVRSRHITMYLSRNSDGRAHMCNGHQYNGNDSFHHLTDD